jgi:DNA-binding NarL/FixJ family response regulator
VRRSHQPPADGPRPAATRFTRRQTEILTLISEGYSDKEIARILDMSTKTVSVHLQRVFDKLNVRTRAAAVARWIVERDALEPRPPHAVARQEGDRDPPPDGWHTTDWSR